MIHKRLEELRNLNNLKQYEVANAIGIVRTTYSSYERGERIPDALTLSRIADYFHVTTDYILGRDYYYSTVPAELIKIANSIDKNQQQEFWNDVIKYAKFLQNRD
jgi:transcriptional regulator with XRE-family HTH domain